MRWPGWLSCVCLAALGGAGYDLNNAAAAAESEASMRVFIGTYTGAKSQGIYQAPFEPATGRLGTPALAVKTPSPSFLAVHPNGRVLYAVGENTNLGGQRGGALSAFRIEAKTGQLTLLNEQPSGGSAPCHLAVDAAGKYVLTANYGSGSIAALPIRADGGLGEPSATIQHQGSSVHPQRQTGPHAHFITMDPANRLALACDLGLDRVLVYRLDPARGALIPNDPPSAPLPAGAGPRHLVFHPEGRRVYVINEMGSSLTVMNYDPGRGALEPIQTISTLPESFQGKSTCAEIQVHPSGKFLYGSNRGHDSLAIFAIDSQNGRLTLVEHQPTQGKEPRHFALDPSGRWLLAENQNSDTIAVFSVDPQTGRLRPTGQSVSVGSPVCAVFWSSRP